MLTRRQGEPADDRARSDEPVTSTLSRRATLRLALVGALAGAAVAAPGAAHAQPAAQPRRYAPTCLEDLWGR